MSSSRGLGAALPLFFFVYNSFMEFLTNLWNSQPTTVMGVGAAIVLLIGIYISLLQKYQ